MRPVDYVETPPEPTGFWYRGRGWRSNILPCLFGALILVSGIIATFIENTWWAILSQGAGIIVVILVANEVLKRTLRN